uniref:NADH-ubiquinone oxidoreductase chain 3 n=1 Tax=Fissurella volcano TaxID=707972 RepID=H6V545_FISVO|nr:NADH dehydrogenase subunit 3 [Fissurella volcano]AFB78097.1 NADH dehydrogenase subunit 3 [Fissurella volcano]
MYYMYLYSFVAVGLPVLVMILGGLVSKRVVADGEKRSPFECGFDPLSSSRIPFSLRFFLLAVVFLVFDVEIALFFPVVSAMVLYSGPILFNMSFFFSVILLFGLFFEWKEGSLDWISG